MWILLVTSLVVLVPGPPQNGFETHEAARFGTSQECVREKIRLTAHAGPLQSYVCEKVAGEN